MLLYGARMNDNQKVSILAASVICMPNETSSLYGNFSAPSSVSGTASKQEKDTLVSRTPPSTAVYLQHSKCSAVASVIRQSKGPSTTKRDTPHAVNVATVDSDYKLRFGPNDI